LYYDNSYSGNPSFDPFDNFAGLDQNCYDQDSNEDGFENPFSNSETDFGGNQFSDCLRELNEIFSKILRVARANFQDLKGCDKQLINQIVYFSVIFGLKIALYLVIRYGNKNGMTGDL
jgi:hypothetical protein